MNKIIERLLENDKVPDFLIRNKIVQLLEVRLKDETLANRELQQQHLMKIIDDLKQSPIAIETLAANEQHYEVPTAFFKMVMQGRHLEDAATLAVFLFGVFEITHLNHNR